MNINIIPAIDILDGQVVRLLRGDYKQVTYYPRSPLDQAKFFESCNIKRIHLVDLNGAREGIPFNLEMISQIACQTNLEIEMGGGIRDMTILDQVFESGVSYAILGSATLRNPDFLSNAVDKYPRKIIVGIDARNGMVATDGWTKTSSTPAAQLIKELINLDLKEIIFTDISRDGTLEGPNLEYLRSVSRDAPFSIISSGGISSLEDIRSIERLNHEGYNISGVIIGKAIYENQIRLEEIIQ